MNRDAKTPSALIALARTRRMQRALAHAYLHRHSPLPGLRSSLGYMTTTACVAEDAGAITHRMHVLGVSWMEGVAYVVEELGGTDAPIVYRLWLRGPRHGFLVPMHAWYEHGEDAAAIRAKLAVLAPSLAPVQQTTAEAWMLSTRIVQRRAQRIAGAVGHADVPIRKFALQLTVEPVSGGGPSGKTTVTAFLRPHAQLMDVWTLPGDRGAIARISYTGIPNGLGLDKDAVVLLTAGWDDELDEPDSAA